MAVAVALAGLGWSATAQAADAIPCAGSDSVNLLMTSPQAIEHFAKALAMTGAARNNHIPIRGDAPEIAVTGSRIARKDNVPDSPIVTLNREALEVSGPGTMESVLNTLPQFAALRPGSSPSAARGGRNNANLRGLGINRNLILLDGRRMQPSDLQGAVDLNTIPEALLGSIEVITGGASATYGSDAIAGVVNFRLNNRFKGVQLDAQYGVTDKGDSGVYDFSGLAGSSFAGDRGHFVAAASFLRRDFTPRGAREFFHHQTPSSILVGGSITPDASNLPSQAALNSVFARYGFTGTVPRNSTLAVNPDNTLFTTTSTATVPILNLRYGDPPYFIAPDGSRVVNFSGESVPLQQAMDKYNVFLKADFKVTDSLSAYGQFMHAHYKTRHQIYSIPAQGLTIPSTNPFIPADLRAVLASRPRPNDPLTYSFGTGRIDAPFSQLDTYNVNQGLVGLKGNVPRFDWTWDLYGSRGQTTDVTDRNVNILRSALVALLNAPDGGRSVCPGGYNPFIHDPLTSAPETQACFEYVNRPTTGTAKFSQKIIEGTVQGALFKLPAGDLKFAAGVNYRSNAFIDRPDALSREGLLVVDTVGSPIVPNREGKDHVNEVFGELLIPVLRDVPFVESLTVDVAGRYSNYKSIGGVNTYKASGDWQIARPIRLRGGYQRAIRAPSLDELFPAAALKQETADTHTFGVVLSSPFKHNLLSGLQLSVDYYRINLKDAIGTITRDASGATSQILAPRLNLASYTTSGIDAQLDWTAPLSELGLDKKWGRVALNAVVSYTKDYKIQDFVGDAVVNYAGTIGNGQIDSFSISHPTWKAQASATWKVGNLSTTLRGRWIDSMFNSLDASGTTRTRAGVPSKTYFDLHASWHLRDDLTVRASVVNVADTQPPFFAVEEATDVAVYDILGRRFGIGVTKRF